MASHNIYFRVDEETHRQLREIAEKEDRTLSYVVTRIIKSSLPNAKAAAEKKWKTEVATAICMRVDRHNGPCNGLPRATCPQMART